MDALGVEIVVDPVRQAPGGAVTDTDGQVSRGARTMGDFQPVSTGRVSPDEIAALPSREELRRRNQERIDAQPLTVRCGLDGCGWRFDGPAGEARERARQHRADRHGITGTGRVKTHAEEHAEGEAAAALRRQRLALEALDAGEPQQPTEEVAAPAGPRAVDGATPGDASGEGNEPGTRAATSWSRKAKTREEVLDAIRRWAADHDGEPPSLTDLRGNGPEYVSANAARRHFGTWSDAVEAAGFPRPTRQRRDAWTRERAIARLRAIVSELGRVPRSSEAGLGLPGTGTYTRLFGSWADYVEAAGFDRPTRGGDVQEMATATAAAATPAASDRRADSPSRPDAADPLSVAGLTLDEIQACGQIMAAAAEAVRPLPAASRKRVAGLVAAIFHYSKAA